MVRTWPIRDVAKLDITLMDIWKNVFLSWNIETVYKVKKIKNKIVKCVNQAIIFQMAFVRRKVKLLLMILEQCRILLLMDVYKQIHWQLVSNVQMIEWSITTLANIMKTSTKIRE